MAVITKWSNVSVSVQSALAASKTITAATKASPCVISSTAHGYSNGDYVLISAQGMHQINNRVFRVASVATDSFALEGEDSTGYDTFVSGGAQKITFGTTLSTLTDVNASGGGFSFEDITTIHDRVRVQTPGLPDPSTYSFQSIWDPSDAGLIALKSASDSQAQRAILFGFANGQKFTFNGYVGCSLSPTGSAQQVIKTEVVFTAQGAPKAYSS